MARFHGTMAGPMVLADGTTSRKAAPKPEKAERKPVGWRAREWRRMLDEGVYRNQSELARGEGCPRRR